MEILSEFYNGLLRRREIKFRVRHNKGPTPTLFQIREKIASEFKASLDLTFVIKMKTQTGLNETVGEAHIYDSEHEARILVPEYVRKRNQPKRRSKKA